MAKKQKKAKSAHRQQPKRLIRHVRLNQRTRIIGSRGKVVKRIVPGRSYIIEVREGRGVGKLIGYVNNVKKGIPQSKPFTRSMHARLLHTRIDPTTRILQSGRASCTITSDKKIRSQLPTRLLNDLRRNPGKAFSVQIIGPGFRIMTPLTYNDGKMTNVELRDYLTSGILATLRTQNYRMSPKPSGIEDPRMITRLSKVKLKTQFYKPNSKAPKKRKIKKSKTKNRSISSMR